jgi:hypothetical protein
MTRSPGRPPKNRTAHRGDAKLKKAEENLKENEEKL